MPFHWHLKLPPWLRVRDFRNTSLQDTCDRGATLNDNDLILESSSTIPRGPQPAVIKTLSIAPSYCYQPLTSLQCFRLIELNTSCSPSNSPIKCTLTERDLSDGKYPTYTALSYAWGDPEPKALILIDGMELIISKNLYETMKQLREYHLNGIISTPFLWIDMICINQQDPHERSHQVSIMKNIFQRSKLTIAWLGPAEGDNDKAIEIIRNRILNKEGVGPLNRLFGYHYWSRTWIIQEICVSTDVRIACGKGTVPWPNDLRFLWDSPELPDLDLHYPGVLTDLRRTFQRPEQVKMTLDALVCKAYLSNCTDGRDAVYALLGLVTAGCGASIIPDYTKSECSIFCEALRTMYKDYSGPLFKQHKVHLKDMAEYLDDIKKSAAESPHNPFLDDDEIRIDCKGLWCNTYRLFLAMAHKHIPTETYESEGDELSTGS